MPKVGMIGCGKIAQMRHAPEYAENQDCDIVAVYNRHRAAAEALAQQYGGRVCGSIEERLASGLDAVSVPCGWCWQA